MRKTVRRVYAARLWIAMENKVPTSLKCLAAQAFALCGAKAQRSLLETIAN
jgi:hypothetical protein